MKAIRIAKHGGPEVLTLVDIVAPRPKPREVLVRVERAGVNFADINLRKGTVPFSVSLPVTPGLEIAGVVAELGDGVRSLREGDRVVALALATGGYAEYVAIPEEQVFVLPASTSFDVGAAITLQGFTAHTLLHDQVAVGPGVVVLLHAAAGGMGLLLTRWAKRLGATVIATVSTTEKAQIAREAGADHVIVYTQDDFVGAAKQLTHGRGVDYVIDGVGKSTLVGSLDAVAVRGHVVFYGWASGIPDPIDPRALIGKSIVLSGGNLANSLRTREEGERRIQAVFAGLEAGWLRPRIDSVLPLEAAAQAQARLEARATTGKVLLAMTTSSGAA